MSVMGSDVSVVEWMRQAVKDVKEIKENAMVLHENDKKMFVAAMVLQGLLANSDVNTAKLFDQTDLTIELAASMAEKLYKRMLIGALCLLVMVGTAHAQSTAQRQTVTTQPLVGQLKEGPPQCTVWQRTVTSKVVGITEVVFACEEDGKITTTASNDTRFDTAFWTVYQGSKFVGRYVSKDKAIVAARELTRKVFEHPQEYTFCVAGDLVDK